MDARRRTVPQALTLAALASLALLSSAGAQEKPAEPEIITDRPDFTESSVVVPFRSFQIEGGLTWENGAAGVDTFNAPELLMRWGWLKRTELRLIPPEYLRIRGGGQRASGFGDMAVGFKQQLGPYRGWDFSLISHINLPTGSSALTSDHVDPEVALTWARDLDERWSLSGQFAFFWPTEDDRRNFTWAPTVSLARSLGGRWGTFLEYAGAFPERGGDVQVAHHGYTYAVSSRAQADFHLGFGLSRAAPDFFIGTGYAVRF